MAGKRLYFIIHKPYKVLSQFSNEGDNIGLGEIFKGLPKDVYPVGRLDLDSEGLLILTNDKSLNSKLLDPANNHTRTYWVEVEGVPEADQMDALRNGVRINLKGKQYTTRKAQVEIIKPKVPERDPPVNYKKHPERSWLSISLTEGKNRQVRRMTAKIGCPTLRLIRTSIEELQLDPLKPGEIKQISEKAIYRKLKLF